MKPPGAQAQSRWSPRRGGRQAAAARNALDWPVHRPALRRGEPGPWVRLPPSLWRAAARRPRPLPGSHAAMHSKACSQNWLLGARRHADPGSAAAPTPAPPDPKKRGVRGREWFLVGSLFVVALVFAGRAVSTALD